MVIDDSSLVEKWFSDRKKHIIVKPIVFPASFKMLKKVTILKDKTKNVKRDENVVSIIILLLCT